MTVMTDFQQDGNEGLYERITTGFHEGLVISDLGMASYSLRESLGIESLIGVAGYGNQSKFYSWMEKMTGADLSDWEPVTMELFECWMPARTEYFAHDENPFSYCVWRRSPDRDAVKSRRVEIFALRHRAWPLLLEGRERAFICEVERSWAVAEWSRKNPGQAASPEVMNGRQARGFALKGIPKGTDTEIQLTWPSSDLWSLVEKAHEYSKNGVTEIHIVESGVALRFEDIDTNTWRQMDQIDRQYGQNGYLLDIWNVISGTLY